MEKTLQLSTIVHTSYMFLDWAILFATATVQCLQIAFYGSLGAYFLLGGTLFTQKAYAEYYIYVLNMVKIHRTGKEEGIGWVNYSNIHVVYHIVSGL